MRRFPRLGVAAAAAATTVLFVSAAGQAGGAPVLAFTPATAGSFEYQEVAVGQTASQVFTLTNSGGSATAVLTIALSGSPAFTKTEDSCSATSRGPRKSCSVTVEYAPTASQGDGAMLTADGKKPAAGASITLNGSGTGAFSRYVYWTNFSGGSRISRADLDGQNANQSFITGASGPYGVAVDAG